MSRLPRWLVPAALRRLGDRRRGSSGPAVSWQRTAVGAVSGVRFEIAAPLARAGELAQALAGLVAEGAASIGLTVGWVGVVAGEEPVLVALAPQRDLVAPRFRDSLTSGAAHRRPNLWLTLAPGTYLASVVDPLRPFSGSQTEILSLVRGGRAGHALASELTAGPAGVRITLALYAPRPELIRLLSLARNGLRELPG
ncbi:MAG TPA: hypothetical protein PLB88_00705 [Thermoanaerobaculaceae bacterium]|nr:hypothetical protein [Thermoanaerobaculaceae bacterium]